MNEWKNERMKEWKNENERMRMKEWKNKRMKEWRNEGMKEWRKEGRKERKKEKINERKNEWRMKEWMNEWLNEWMSIPLLRVWVVQVHVEPAGARLLQGWVHRQAHGPASGYPPAPASGELNPFNSMSYGKSHKIPPCIFSKTKSQTRRTGQALKGEDVWEQGFVRRG